MFCLQLLTQPKFNEPVFLEYSRLGWVPKVKFEDCWSRVFYMLGALLSCNQQYQ